MSPVSIQDFIWSKKKWFTHIQCYFVLNERVEQKHYFHWKLMAVAAAASIQKSKSHAFLWTNRYARDVEIFA